MKQKRLLSDFNLTRWKSVNILALKDTIFKATKKEMFGELNHPDESIEERLNEDRVAIKITDVMIESNAVYGDVECLDNENGRKAQEIFDNGGRLSIRSNRGITTWDVVER